MVLAGLVDAGRAVSRRRRRQLAGAAIGVLVALFAQDLWRARAELHDLRGELDATQAELDAASTDLDRTRQRVELSGHTIDLVRSEAGLAADARSLLEAASRNAMGEIATVDAAQAQTDLALFSVAVNSLESRACFDGVSEAIDAHRDGDSESVVAALRGATDHCNRTLARATGARFPYDFADPFVLRAGDRYYGYSTNAGAGDIQVISSADLATWELSGNALAALPAWAAPNATWAPAVLERGGRYVMYYTARDAASGHQCISRAVAPAPTGPFLDDSTAPLVCQHTDGGSIDPSPFVDGGGRAFLLWKSEGKGASPATIWSQELAPDGLALVGAPRPLLAADRPFEQGIVEAPSMLRTGGSYQLLYAAGPWSSRRYLTAYATCAGPLGPCTKPGDGRILTSGRRIAGPGGSEVFLDREGAPWVAFHAYAEPNVGYPSSRYLHLAPVRIVDGRPVIDTTT